MSKIIVDVKDRNYGAIIEISDDAGQYLFRISATHKGIEITGIAETGDMIIRPKTSNQVLITYKDDVRI